MARQWRGVVTVPTEHPDNDLLADLAADVLPDDLAGHVQDHVINCPACANLLAEAEGIRSLLLQSEPERMPDQVLTRLERALAVARQEDEAARQPAGRPVLDTAETRAMPRITAAPSSADGRGSEGPRTDPGRRIARSGAGRGPATGPLTGTMPAAGGPKTGRLSRMSTSTQSLRRQAIEEQKAEEPSLFERLAPVLKIAAAVLVVVGAGGLLLQLRGSGSDATSVASSAADSGSAATAPLLAPVQATETDYTKADLGKQVKALIATSQQESLKSAAVAPDAAATPSAETKADPSAPAAGLSAGGSQLALRTPAILQACLKAINATQVQPVAVDLASYAGREAAIIVLPADGGGYEVHVVARDCRAGNDTTFDVVTVQP